MFPHKPIKVPSVFRLLTNTAKTLVGEGGNIERKKSFSLLQILIQA